jgi:D-beta-D-heptose 7-phosphate kinase/D-beta-D-heptose 1-phosphate adenosyltransferase
MAGRHACELLDQLGHPRVLVVGDLILDRYTWGDAERVSQEAPVILLRVRRREARPGGAANVAQMVQALEASRTIVAGLVGDDPAGEQLQQLLQQGAVQLDGLVRVVGRPTTVKERFIGMAQQRHPHQILRVDEEVRDEPPASVQKELIERICALIPFQDVVLLSDYGKGVCTDPVVRTTIETCQSYGKPILVDPARGSPFRRYRGATLLKPNRLEAGLALGRNLDRVEDALEAAPELVCQSQVEAVVLSLDRDGMVWATAAGSVEHCPTRPRDVYDITGAGDMVLATLGICLGSGWKLRDAVELANIAGGLEVERVGVTVLTRQDLRKDLGFHPEKMEQKIVDLPQLLSRLAELRAEKRRIVFTNGCFDLLHAGHVRYLHAAAKYGDCLVVAVNSDQSVRRLKGPQRPIVPARYRAEMLAALECVDFVIIFDEDTPHRLLEAIRPDVLVKGGTYRPEEVVGREVVHAYGGQVVVGPAVPGWSTTALIEKIRTHDEPAPVRQVA